MHVARIVKKSKNARIFRIEIFQVFIQPKPNPRGKILTEEVPCKPNKRCYVCSERREITLKLNAKLTTVQSLENKFLKGILHMVAPDVMISLTGNIIISSEEGETKGDPFLPPLIIFPLDFNR